jgi:hypothetical protein
MIVSVRYLIYQLCFGKIFGDKKCKFLDKALLRVTDDLDICRILRRMHEIYNLKKTLFSKEQRTLFNFSERPSITLEEKYE